MEGRPDAEGLDRLTPREREVWELLRLGLTNLEIAERLGVTLDGAKYHVSEIIGKLDVRDRYEAASWPERRRWWTVALAPIGLFWRKAAATSPVQLSSVAMVTSAGLAAAALAGIGLIVVLLVRSDGELSDPTSIQAASVPPATPQSLPTALSRDEYLELDNIAPGSKLITRDRDHLSICVEGAGGFSVSQVEVDMVRQALEDALALVPSPPPEYSQPEPTVTRGCPPAAALIGRPLADDEGFIGVARVGINGTGDPSPHRLFVYFVSPDIYGAHFGTRAYFGASAQMICPVDSCLVVTTALYASPSVTAESLREGLVLTLSLRSLLQQQ